MEKLDLLVQPDQLVLVENLELLEHLVKEVNLDLLGLLDQLVKLDLLDLLDHKVLQEVQEPQDNEVNGVREERLAPQEPQVCVCYNVSFLICIIRNNNKFKYIVYVDFHGCLIFF